MFFTEKAIWVNELRVNTRILAVEKKIGIQNA